MDGTDASQPALWDPAAAHAACRANPWCQGFNNKGHTKQIVVGSWKPDSALCSYVRTTSAGGSCAEGRAFPVTTALPVAANTVRHSPPMLPACAVAWKESAPDRIAVRIGVGRDGQNCLTVSSGDWAVTQR